MNPPRQPRLPEGLRASRRTATFNAATLPAGLRSRHTTADGVWARIQVVEGAILYRILAPEAEVFRLDPETPGIVAPTIPHELELVGPVELYVEFFR